MFEVDDEPIETLHIYIEREQPPRPSLLPLVLSVLALSILIAIGLTAPYQQPVTRAVIRVPAVLLPLKTFTAKVTIIPTGIQVYPATTAHGILTITNGSIIAQIIPAGFTVQNVATDRAVYVPAGNANGYGYATVAAHALVSGKSGNIPTLAINQVIGSSVFIRNLSAFSGGRDSYSVKYATAQDKQVAMTKAREALTHMIAGLHYPCSESISSAVRVSWRCQMLTYHIPAFYHVTGVSLIGKNLLISVWFVPRPIRYWVK
jgi:hypothetical protein